MLGYGAIGRRLTELLAPFRMTVCAVRRQTRSESGVRVIPEADLTRVLPQADCHVVNILPDNESTKNYVNAPAARLVQARRPVLQRGPRLSWNQRAAIRN
jgi:phosphoglycerate dehydrogenase-like enzyme